jgi:methionyl-tRNA formyltransferase
MVTPLRIVFFGTPEFAVPSLARLAASAHDVVGVVSQPDRPRGRGQKVVPEAVKVAAIERHLPVLQPATLKDDTAIDAIRALEPDLGVVAAYGRILPRRLIDLPRLGMINVHASLLPRWRGAAPVHRAILAGDRETGVTIMHVVFELDAGPMLASTITPIAPDETSRDLERRLAEIGAALVAPVVDQLAAGAVAEHAQGESGVTYAARLERRESQIDWARPAIAIHNQIRGLQPWPLAAAMLNGRRVALLRSVVPDHAAASQAPGTIIDAARDGVLVAAGTGVVRVTDLQEAGRAPMSAHAYLQGRRVSPGDRFEPLPDSAS